ncbi:hypothetical protein D3C80_1894860 [compost metagenome]
MRIAKLRVSSASVEPRASRVNTSSWKQAAITTEVITRPNEATRVPPGRRKGRARFGWVRRMRMKAAKMNR